MGWVPKVIGAIIVLAICGGAAYFFVEMTRDQGAFLGLAFAEPQGDQVEMHILVTTGMPMVSPPPLDQNGDPDWAQWRADHFRIKDSQGAAPPMERVMMSSLVSDREIGAGAPDHFVVVKLKPGEKYDFVYVPNAGEPQKYQRVLEAPKAATKFARLQFEPAY